MIRSGEEILADIDCTLDQLIRNAEALRTVSVQTLAETEVEALQKTQESLLAHILHMNELLDSDKKQQLMRKKAAVDLQGKIAHFSRLNARLITDVAMKFKVRPLRSKKKKKAI